MYFVDSHCHLSYKRFPDFLSKAENQADYSVKAIIERAKNAHVDYMVTIGTEFSDIEELKEISESYENVFRTVGIHPENAHAHLQNYSINEIKKIISENSVDKKVIGIGEIGLDYHSEGAAFADEQKQVFAAQIEAAEECGLPVCIHTRSADEDTAEIIKRYPGTGGVMHCFSSGPKLAEESLKLGYYISISGIVTFKKSAELQEIVKNIPLDRLLIETDAPFLAPVPFRGKINEPAYVVHTAEKIAEILNLTPEEIAARTSENFFRLFDRAAK